MALEKLKIKAEKDQEGDFAEEIEVLFNPNQLQIDKTGWRLGDGYPVAANELATLTINLFFDTTLSGSPPENVQKYTKKIFNLSPSFSRYSLVTRSARCNCSRLGMRPSRLSCAHE